MKSLFTTMFGLSIFFCSLAYAFFMLEQTANYLGSFWDTTLFLVITLVPSVVVGFAGIIISVYGVIDLLEE